VASPIKMSPLHEVKLDAMACKRCDLHHERNLAVPGDGNPNADIVLLGEAPGYHEDQLGLPFCGPKAGGKLDEWLRAADISRKELFISNVLKCRPPNNRWKVAERMDAPQKCYPFLEKQLRALQPRAVILCGRHATEWVLLRGSSSTADPFGPWVGRVCRRRDLYGETRFATVWHPAYLLRQPNPWEEARCIDALAAVRDYVRAVKADQPAPLQDLYDVRPVGRVQHQQRMRLFHAVPGKTEEGEEETKVNETRSEGDDRANRLDRM
jgi:DNA polymerase